jgi:hypothetical protein
MEKKRIVPTHFMEVFSREGFDTFNTEFNVIKELPFYVSFTKRNNGIKTVAIWKICKKEFHSETFLRAIGSTGRCVLPLETLKAEHDTR